MKHTLALLTLLSYHAPLRAQSVDSPLNVHQTSESIKTTPTKSAPKIIRFEAVPLGFDDPGCPECYRIDASQIKSLSASSTLGEHYKVEHLLDAKDHTAWCEGVKGLGAHESIELYFKTPVRLTTLSFRPGYLKSTATLLNNASPKSLLVETSDGQAYQVFFPPTPRDFLTRYPDGFHFVLNFSAQPLDGLRLTLGESYPGNKYPDTCLSGLHFEATTEEGYREYFRQ